MPATPQTPAPVFSPSVDTKPATRKKGSLKFTRSNARWSDADIESMLAQLKVVENEGSSSQGGFEASLWTGIAHGYDDRAKTARSCETRFARLEKDFSELK